MSVLAERTLYNDDPSPEYRVTVTRSNTVASGSTTSVNWHSPFDDPPAPINVPRRVRSKPERYVYDYSLMASGASLHFIISVEPSSGKPIPGKYSFRLSLKVDKVERPLEDAVSLHLAVDPRNLEFLVFVFPGKSSLPVGSLYSYRVWLRVNGIDHRLFGEDDLWVVQDPDFSSIADASFARLKSMTTSMQIYDAHVGGARVQFIVRWQQISEELYKYILEYDANGVGGVLIDDFRLLLQGDPRKVSFLIYTVPMNSMPAGASHRIRVWLKTLTPLAGDRSPAYSLPYHDSYTFQRIWKSDNFKIGARLDFGTLGSKMIMGYSSGPAKTIVMSQSGEGTHRFKNDDIVEVG